MRWRRRKAFSDPCVTILAMEGRKLKRRIGGKENVEHLLVGELRLRHPVVVVAVDLMDSILQRPGDSHMTEFVALNQWFFVTGGESQDLLDLHSHRVSLVMINRQR